MSFCKVMQSCFLLFHDAFLHTVATHLSDLESSRLSKLSQLTDIDRRLMPEMTATLATIDAEQQTLRSQLAPLEGELRELKDRELQMRKTAEFTSERWVNEEGLCR